LLQYACLRKRNLTKLLCDVEGRLDIKTTLNLNMLVSPCKIINQDIQLPKGSYLSDLERSIFHMFF